MIDRLFGYQIYFPVAVFLYFYWKKNGSLPFPFILPISPGYAVLGAPPPVVPNPPPPPPPPPIDGPPCDWSAYRAALEQWRASHHAPPPPPPPPVVTPPPTPVTPPPPVDGPPVITPLPPTPNWRQTIGETPVHYSYSPTINYPTSKGNAQYQFTFQGNTTIGGLPQVWRNFQQEQKTAQEHGVWYTLMDDDIHVNLINGPMNPETKTMILQKLGYNAQSP